MGRTVANTGQLEIFRNVSVLQNHPRQVDKVLLNESYLVRFRHEPLPTEKPSAHEEPASNKKLWGDNETNPTNTKAEENSGADGDHLDVSDFIGSNKEANKEGLYALNKADLFNILCIPPYKENHNIDYDSLVDSAAEFCQTRRAFFIIDSPIEWTDKDKAKNGIQSIGEPTSYAAVFFPRIKQPNSLRENQIEEFVPCGAIAGVFARTDVQRGVWKAPAGTEATLTGVPQLSVPLTDPENGELNPLGINCLRTLPAFGRVIWGSRTRKGDDRLTDHWKYIPVRRFALFLEESLYRGTQWVVFEPNDEPLWAQIRLNLGAFMHTLFLQGAFQGTKAEDAYFVKCDKETTIQNDINLGIVNIIVGFAPLKPAEFVILKIQQIAGQIAV
ncbi:phage tail sheath family protein [Nostoc sp.]|uniref:phage tail sheath family protein n=1 Tax=Nostoc sp. TaxID=1180 RepID=UPI002FFAE2D7